MNNEKALNSSESKACDEADNAIVVPYQDISTHALQGLLEEFITREGTNYGEIEFSLEDQRAFAMSKLEQGEIKIVFYPKTQHCQLLEISDFDFKI